MKRSTVVSRPSTVSAGKVGEDQAVALLRRAGLKIVERNYRCRLGEIDVIARDGDTLVFVEIRTRSSAAHGDAIETVGSVKQRRIARAAEHYLAFEKPKAKAFRFDVVGITAGQPVHIRDAFRI
jgi:putative endonuclease